MPRRPSWREAFFSQRRLTSKLKHLILSQYVREFAYHLGSAHATVYYVDGFAGRGTYRHPDGNIEEGSPLLVAGLAEGIRSSGATFRLKCLNVEENRKNFAGLQLTTQAYMGEIIIKNFHATFVDALPEILSILGSLHIPTDSGH